MSVPLTPASYFQPPKIQMGWLVRGWDQFKEKPGTWIGLQLLIGLILLVFYAVIAFATGTINGYSVSVHDLGVMYDKLRHGVHQPPAVAHLTTWQLVGHFVADLPENGLWTVGLGCYYRLALSQMRGESVSIGAAFSALRLSWPLFVVGMVVELPDAISAAAVNVIPPTMYFLSELPTCVVQGLLMFAVPLIVDRDLDPVTALAESFSLLKRQWLRAAVFFFLGQMLGGIGLLLCGVGAFITYPLFILGVTIAYLNFTSPPTPPVMPDYGQPMPGVWPPPPTGGRPGSVAFMQESRPVMENIRRL